MRAPVQCLYDVAPYIILGKDEFLDVWCNEVEIID